ncbi:recombinase RecT [Streptomyces chryseus]
MTLAVPERQQQAPAAHIPQQRGGALSLAHMSAREAWMFCESLANTPLLPDQYRKQPASVLWAMEYGRALGLDVVTTITTIHVIKGKPTQSADLMLGRARSAGHRVRIKSERHQCVVRIQRHDDPDDETVIEWTLDDAVTAGLCTLRDGRPYARDDKNRPQSWEKFPRAMLRARAIAECVRAACPEVLHGAIYTPEELGAVVDQEGNAVDVEAGTPVPETIPHTVQARPAEQAPQVDDITLAQQATDAAAVRRLYDAAKDRGASAEHLAAIAAIGATKPGAKPQQQATPSGQQETTGREGQASTRSPVIEGTVVDRADDQEHAAELAAMYEAGQAAGLADQAEADALFTAHHKCSPQAATVAQLREQRDDLLDAARAAGTAS